MNNSVPPSIDAVPAKPIRIGHYELLDCIGRGGMGLVYRARDTKLDRQVAIKCLRTELFEAHYVERFKREALLLAKLNHPNIVQIYDFIEASEQVALVMELVDGQNLQLHLREHIVPFGQRMRWLMEIAQGLAVAHDAGIIHRDLKAENILINQRKVAKITDLGIAKSQDFNATLTDHIAGSYCSMSPEQAMGEPLDFKSDLFSFGILAYQLLCGAHPFGDTNNKLQLMQRIISHPPAAPGKHNPNLPVEINDLLGQLLSKDPDKRPHNTHWVAAQLEKLSHLQPANDFVSDDTQALIPSNSDAANQSNVKNTGINSAVRTQDHPTFETRFVPVNTAPKKSRWLPIKNYLIENKISVGFSLFSVLIIAAVMVWQLQPKPPKYVAVIPPKLTAEGMQESQQELVKGAVYDAIQQSVIQLNGYYLIPREEIADVNGNTETVRKATAADELITTKIQCKIETCTIALTRLVPEKGNTENRLRVEGTKTVDILTDNYLSTAQIVAAHLGQLYNQKNILTLDNISSSDYQLLIEVAHQLRNQGASENLLTKIDNLNQPTKALSLAQSIYREIALDLFHESKQKIYLDKLENNINSSLQATKTVEQLYNLYSLQLAQNRTSEAEVTAEKIRTLNASDSTVNELYAHIMMYKNDYKSATNLYKKAVTSKTTANNLINLANAYWYSGNTTSAKKYVEEALKLSPAQHKANGLYGLILLFSGEIQDASQAFEIALATNKNDITNLTNLGLCYLLLEKYNEADKLFTRAAKIAPKVNTILLNKADARNLANNKQASYSAYEETISQTVKEERTDSNLRTLSQAYAHINNFPEALKALEELQASDPQNIETMYTAALVHTLAKNKTSAIFNVEKTLSNGMHPMWFKFAWFDELCKEQAFEKLMRHHGETNRCSPH